MMSATTVNDISPVVILPFFHKTNVKEYEKESETNGSSLIPFLMVQANSTVASDILKWYRSLRFIENVANESESLPKILEQVYVSSTHSEVLNKIARIRTLISDWDKDFKAPSMKTISNALETAALFPKKFPVPKICLSSDGEISFELVKGKKHAVIDIDEDNDFSYAYFQGNKFVPGKERAEIASNKLPTDLVKYLSS